MNDIGQRLKELRLELGMSQREFAEKIGIHVMTLSRYEVGKCRLSAKTLKRLQEVFKVNPDWLLEGKGKPFKEERQAEKSPIHRNICELCPLYASEDCCKLFQKFVPILLLIPRDALRAPSQSREEAQLPQLNEHSLKTAVEKALRELPFQSSRYRY